MRRLRQLIVILLCTGLASTGCSKTVEIPRDQLGSAQETAAGYRVQMVDDSYYMAKRFSITDSTLVIEKLNPADSRYKKVKVPITIPLRDVESVSKYDVMEGTSFAVAATLGIIAILMINLANDPITLGN